MKPDQEQPKGDAVERKYTTIRLDPEIYFQAKVAAAKENRRPNLFIEDAIRERLQRCSS